MSAPSCAGSLLADSFAIADAPFTAAAENKAAVRFNSGRLAAQADCQAGILRAVRALVEQSLDQPPVHSELPPELQALGGRCHVRVARDEATGLTLPRTGPSCAPAIGEPGEVVNVPALQNCLASLIDNWASRAAAGAPRPNIIVIDTDDQRWDMIDAKHSVDGTSWVMNQVRQELVNSGVTFSNFFHASPTCSPSRASLLTGQSAHVHGTLSNLPPYAAPSFKDAQTLPIWLQTAGYRTGLIGKYMNLYDTMKIGPSQWYVPPGWDEWRATTSDKYFDYYLVENSFSVYYGTAPADYATDVLRDKALTFMTDSAALGKPFFLYFTPPAPHEPYTPAPRHAGSFNGVPPFRPPSYNEADVSDKPRQIRNAPLLTAAGRAQIDGWRQGALESLQAVDEAVAAFMNQLRAMGLDQTTIVIYTGDNGFLWGEHRISGKEEPYEEAIRAPFIIRYPPLAPLPRTETRLVTTMDIASTLVSLAGATALIPQNGVSLERLIDGTATTWRNDVLVEGWPGGHPWATVRETQWKYTEYATGDKELYNTATDPFELTNVATDPAIASRNAAMHSRLLTYRPGWPVDVGCSDADHDSWIAASGAVYCGTAVADCDDASANDWATPGEAGVYLDFPRPGKTTLVWSAPSNPGCPASLVKYDTIRSDLARNFTNAVCIETNNGPNTTSTDPSVPSTNSAFFYLVRARNSCPAGVGTLGHASNGTLRTGAACP